MHMSATWLPSNINVERLAGPNRSKWAEGTFRDDVVFSPNGDHMALAYSIAEIGMSKEVGRVLWARLNGKFAEGVRNPKKILALCWFSPWCHWVNNHTFLFKIWHEHKGEIFGPLVAINVDKGFQVLPGTNNSNSWVTDDCDLQGEWTKFSRRALFFEVRNNA
jgi:hypothetical protein